MKPPPTCQSPSAPLRARLLHLAATMLCGLVALVTGCSEDGSDAILLVEFLDEVVSDGKPQLGETIRIELSNPVPDGIEPQQIVVDTVPESTRWTPRVSFLDETRRRLSVTIVQGQPRLRTQGVHGEDILATGISVTIAERPPLLADIQLRRPTPTLKRAIWEDTAPPGGNGVVDEGDRLRLVFSHPVKLKSAADGEDPESAPRVLVPEQVLLSKERIDQLDDGTTASTWSPSHTAEEREIDILLGSHPILNISGELATSPTEIDRLGPDAPSGVAVAGTRILPLDTIESRYGGPGVASEHEVDIESPTRAPEDALSRYREPGGEFFPGRVRRSFHTLTPIGTRLALVTGGVTPEGRALTDVLQFHPLRANSDLPTFQAIGDGLAMGTYHHTATRLPGEDRQLGTGDDIVLLAGGQDSQARTLDTLVAIFRSGDLQKSLRIVQLEARLQISRAEHAAIATGSMSVLVDGGWSSRSPSGRDLVSAAELITLERRGDRVELVEQQLVRSVGRLHHTLTLLTSESETSTRPWVLAYGGFGRNPYRDQPTPRPGFGAAVERSDPENFFPRSRASVLRWPVLIDVEHPVESIVWLDQELTAAHLRLQHVAVLPQASSKVLASGLTAGHEVLIFGGSLHHPVFGMDQGTWLNWEMSRSEIAQNGGRRPTPDLAVNGIRLDWNAADPAASAVEWVVHPARSPGRVPTRHHATVTHVPDLGFLLAGGEFPGVDGDPIALRSIEAYLEPEARLAQYAWTLHHARTRHRSMLVEQEGRRAIFLVGGVVEGDTPDVEEFPLPSLRNAD